MRRILTLATIAAIALPSLKAETWTLDSCIAYAIEHNLTVKARMLSLEEGELSVTESKDAFLPTASAYGSQSWSFGRGLTAENTYANRNTSNFGWGVNASLPLFQGLKAVRRLDYAKASLAALEEQVEAARDDVTLNVISLYLQALYYAEIAEVAADQLRMSQIELERRQQLLDAGKIAELDVIEAQSQVAQNELSLVNAGNDRRLALLDLSQALQLPDTEGFEVAPVDDTPMPILSADEVFASAMRNNHSILALRAQRTASLKNIRLARAGYMPTLSMNGGIGSNYYKVSGYDNEGFGGQMRHNLSKQLGFSLQIPLFDGFSTRNSIRRANVGLRRTELELEQQEQTLYKAINQAYTQAIGAEKKRSASEVAVRQSEASLKAVTEKYNYGRATATEYEQARSNHFQAVAQNVQARYEALLRARILEFYNR